MIPRHHDHGHGGHGGHGTATSTRSRAARPRARPRARPPPPSGQTRQRARQTRTLSPGAGGRGASAQQHQSPPRSNAAFGNGRPRGGVAVQRDLRRWRTRGGAAAANAAPRAQIPHARQPARPHRLAAGRSPRPSSRPSSKRTDARDRQGRAADDAGAADARGGADRLLVATARQKPCPRPASRRWQEHAASADEL